ncbi:MAG: VOC family protein [Solirubrobacterales bacterium]|nr:VOC family protein [Solirubrobacterales bacterium]
MRRKIASPIVHLELHTGDAPAARELYTELCGWRGELVRAGLGSYLTLELGTGFRGGIVECEAPRPSWLPYVAVPRIAEATDRARAFGAAILLEPREGAAGWRSVIATGSGAELAFWQPK